MSLFTSDEPTLSLPTEEISALLSSRSEPEEQLRRIVTFVGNWLETDVCSIYLLERNRRTLRLAATVGLNQACVGRLRMEVHEGLAGLVAQQIRPLALEQAARHPRFKYFPESEEDAYASFLGVSLIDRSELQGVLIVQDVEARRYSGDEICLLLEATGLLGPIFGAARRALLA